MTFSFQVAASESSLSRITVWLKTKWALGLEFCLRWQFTQGFFSLILTLEERAGALGQPSEDWSVRYIVVWDRRGSHFVQVWAEFCVLGSCLRGLCLVGSPTLSFEAEEPDQSRSLEAKPRLLRGHVGAGDLPAGFWLDLNLRAWVSPWARSRPLRNRDAGRKNWSTTASRAPPPQRLAKSFPSRSLFWHF
jgi:hypothetical protein